MSIKNLPKYLFWFTLGTFIVSLSAEIVEECSRCGPRVWFDIAQSIHEIGTIILLCFALPFTILLIILSFFLKIERKFLSYTLILAIVGFIVTIPLHHAGTCPDKITMADLKQIQLAEKMYFEDHQQYAGYDELAPQYMAATPRDPKTDEHYPLLLTESKQNFEVKAKLDRGGWYVCNRDRCEEQKEE